jgi:hypothetical protein
MEYLLATVKKINVAEADRNLTREVELMGAFTDEQRRQVELAQKLYDLRHGGASESLVAQFAALANQAPVRDFVKSLALPSVIVPDGAVDAQSLIALADLVVSAGGTMNREAAALGVPVYTTYGGRLGGVDEELIRDGRLKPLTDPRALELTKRDPAATPRIRREPSEMLRFLLSALDA